jgi:integrase
MRVTVRIPYISWRNGRPRFSPGPRLRELGLKGQDLKDAKGAWLDLHATEAWTKAKLAEIADRKAHPTVRRPRQTGPKVTTVEDLFEDLWKLRKFKIGEDGALSANSIRDYKIKAKALSLFDPEVWTNPAAAVTRHVAFGLHERLWETKGLSMANGVIAVLRLAYSHTIDRRPAANLTNPCLRLRLPSPKPRVRVATPQEIEALLRSADALEPAIGDAILLALLTGQRQGDLLKVRQGQLEAGRIAIEQGKTGARVGMKILNAMQSRLTAAKARRAAAPRVPLSFIWDPRTGGPYVTDTFRHRFAEVRAAACETEPSLEDFWFMDLRDTAITWLANAGATVPEIAAVSGHSIETVHSILKHYLEANESQANNALDKLQVWIDEQGVKL